MLSIIPGASESKGPGPKPSRSFNLHGGRKIVEGGGEKSKTVPGPNSAANQQEPGRRQRAKKLTSLDDIDRILEKDELDLLNMKKDVMGVQQGEVERAQLQLTAIQKEYDQLRISNNLKEKEYLHIQDTIITLQNVGFAREETIAAANSTKQALIDECDRIMEALSAEQRTLKMQHHMAHRLENEIVECKSECAVISVTNEQTRHEVAVMEGSLRVTRQELLEHEKELDQIVSTVKIRKEQREDKLDMMQSIVSESQNSVTKVKQATLSTLRDMNSSHPACEGHHGHGSPVHHSTKARHSPNALRKGTELEGSNDDDEERGLGGWSVAQLRDLIDRYSTKDLRVQKVIQQEADLRDALVVQKARREDLSVQLMRTAAKHQLLASSRQVYQEVDMKDAALSSARKECEECKEREHRLRQNIESLARAFPRFLTKITKVVHPIPTLDQLPDAVHKLEDEISKLIKTIDTAMLKDATVDDLASISQQATSSSSADGMLSEIGRLQKLPGYERLQRQLFYNLMAARPDCTDQNVRIKLARAIGSTTTTSGQHKTGGGSLYKQVETPDIDADYAPTKLNESRNGEAISDTQSLDRSTIKSISSLVLEKDSSIRNKGTRKDLGRSARR